MPGMRQTNPVAIAILLFVFLVPPGYVASAGPAIWCRDRGIISQETLITLYWPISSVEGLPFVGRAIHWYFNLWYTPKRQTGS
jgi:hypothetical protein